jgi:two-component system, cell cycle sensor histidine kinase and response regulator CckA
MNDRVATVMIVDDQSSVTEIMQDILETRGYRILTPTKPEQALSLLGDTSRPIDLLLTDVIMPQMPGVELARLIQEQWSACRVIFMSGYFVNDLATQGLSAHSVVSPSRP